MKIHIYCDELFPYYGLSSSPGYHDRQVEVSDEFYAEIQAVEAAFRAMQDKLEKLSGNQAAPPPEPEPRMTEDEYARIVAETPVESPESIAAALKLQEELCGVWEQVGPYAWNRVA